MITMFEQHLCTLSENVSMPQRTCQQYRQNYHTQTIIIEPPAFLFCLLVHYDCQFVSSISILQLF